MERATAILQQIDRDPAIVEGGTELLGQLGSVPSIVHKIRVLMLMYCLIIWRFPGLHDRRSPLPPLPYHSIVKTD